MERSEPEAEQPPLPANLEEAQRLLAVQLEHDPERGSIGALIREYLEALKATTSFVEVRKEERRIAAAIDAFTDAIHRLRTVDEYVPLSQAIDAFVTDVADRYLAHNHQHPRSTDP